MTKQPVFDQIFYFGDSLTDGGGIFNLSSAAIELAASFGFDTTGLVPIPISPPYAGVFSNGPVYAQLAPGLLGIPEDQVFNFAFGGAEALGVDTLLDSSGAAIPPELQDVDALPPELAALLTQNTNLPGQLELFEAEVAASGSPLPNSAASIFIGLNDFQSFDPISAFTAPFEVAILAAQVIDANLDAARQLSDAGVGTIILNTLPDASFFPVISDIDPDLAALGDIAVGIVNAGLKTGASVLEDEGINVEIVDLNRLTDEVSDDPTTFGFLEIVEPALLVPSFAVVPNPALVGANLEQVAFFDPIHASAALQEVFAGFTEASLTSNTIFRGDFPSLIFGERGADLVLSGGGNDAVFLRKGDDIAIGGTGNDLLYGQRGSDLIAGGSGDDRIFGGSGADVVVGGSGNDLVFGGRADDGLSGGLGDDTLFGQSGDDAFFFTEATLIGGEGPDTDVFDGGSGEDTLFLALTEDSFALETARFAENFETGQEFEFETLGLVVDNIESVVFSIGLSFDDVIESAADLLDDVLIDRLADADLFGFI
ncbi:MAG: SGNH/GDSL hydrolase family protein [Pseudomonadota bacterium]